MGTVSRPLASVLPVWAVALLGAIGIGVAVHPDDYLTWLPMVLALCLLLAFVIQLALPVKQGLVSRMTASVGGAVVILAVASLVLALVAL